MYAIKVQFFDAGAAGRDVAQPMRIETVGCVDSAAMASAYAGMWQRHDGVAAVWIQADSQLN